MCSYVVLMPLVRNYNVNSESERNDGKIHSFVQTFVNILLFLLYILQIFYFFISYYHMSLIKYNFPSFLHYTVALIMHIPPLWDQLRVFLFLFRELHVGLVSARVAAAEAGGAGQEGPEREGAASERAPLPQTPPGAALRVRLRGARSH